MLASCCLWFATGAALRMLPRMRILALIIFIAFFVLAAVASVPTDLTSPAGRKLMQPLTTTLTAGVSYGAYIGVANYSQVNRACYQVVAVFYVCIVGINAFFTVVCFRGRLSWAMVSQPPDVGPRHHLEPRPDPVTILSPGPTPSPS